MEDVAPTILTARLVYKMTTPEMHAIPEMNMVNVEQLKIRMGIIAGRATGILPINRELHLAAGIDVADANGTETFVFALREIRAALHSAEQLALRFPGGSPVRTNIRNAINDAREAFGDADLEAAKSFEQGDFAAATSIAAGAMARIDRVAAARLIDLADKLPSQLPAVKRPHYLQYLMAYSDRSAAGAILAEIGG